MKIGVVSSLARKSFSVKLAKSDENFFLHVEIIYTPRTYLQILSRNIELTLFAPVIVVIFPKNKIF
jgi:hypothetical protein